MSLCESDTAFNGLEEVLTEISAVDIKFASHWDFKQLRNLKALRTIFFHTMFMRAVDYPLPHLPELTQLSIINAEISYITDDVFNTISKLGHFNMKNNKITEMKRSMFPNPANNLNNIDLR